MRVGKLGETGLLFKMFGANRNAFAATCQNKEKHFLSLYEGQSFSFFLACATAEIWAKINKVIQQKLDFLHSWLQEQLI